MTVGLPSAFRVTKSNGDQHEQKVDGSVAAALVLLVGCGDTSDPKLTQQFIEEFTACLNDEGINVDRVDASVTEDRELQMRGWSASGESQPSAEDVDVDCENALMQELRLRPYLG